VKWNLIEHTVTRFLDIIWNESIDTGLIFCSRSYHIPVLLLNNILCNKLTLSVARQKGITSAKMHIQNPFDEIWVFDEDICFFWHWPSSVSVIGGDWSASNHQHWSPKWKNQPGKRDPTLEREYSETDAKTVEGDYWMVGSLWMWGWLRG